MNVNRKEITKLLTNTLINGRLLDRKYYAKEVTVDYGTNHPKRVDVMQFIPKGVTYSSDIEKGIFICYEVKSCKQDIYSGNGLNFFGEKNYIVMTMETWKDIGENYHNGDLGRYILQNYPESSSNFGILVAVPNHIDIKSSDDVYAEFENPTEFKGSPSEWKLYPVVNCHEKTRKRSMNELLFCMLRSKHSSTNTQYE